MGLGTPGRRPRIALVLAATWSIACSASPSPTAPEPAPATFALPAQPSALATPRTVEPFAACVGTIPVDWFQLFESRSFNLPDSVRFGLAAPTIADGSLYGQFNTNSDSGIGRVDLRTGRFERVTVFPRGASGMVWMVVETPWLVWTIGNSNTNIADWSIVARNIDTGQQLTLATSRTADGGFVFGQQPLPTIRLRRVSWAQPLPRRGEYPEAEIHVYDLGSARDEVLTTGRVSSPVYAGSYLLWAARFGSEGKFSFEAVSADDLKPVTLPERLRVPGPVAYLAGSGDMLAWSVDGSRAATWDFRSGVYAEYRSPDLKHQFQFLQLAGPFLLWYGGVTSSVLDLRSGKGFDVAGTLAGSPTAIAASDVRSTATRAGFVASRVAVAALTEAPAITACAPP